MTVAFLGAMISMHSPYWFLPLIFSVVPLIGFYSARFVLFDTGILLLVISYLFVNRGFALNLPNILLVIGPFFLFAGVWFSARNKMIITQMKDVIEKKSDDRSMTSFRISSLVVIFNHLFLGAFLAILGSILGMYSSLETGLDPNIQNILMVIFSSLVFFMIYMNIKFLSLVEGEE